MLEVHALVEARELVVVGVGLLRLLPPPMDIETRRIKSSLYPPKRLLAGEKPLLPTMLLPLPLFGVRLLLPLLMPPRRLLPLLPPPLLQPTSPNLPPLDPSLRPRRPGLVCSDSPLSPSPHPSPRKHPRRSPPKSSNHYPQPNLQRPLYLNRRLRSQPKSLPSQLPLPPPNNPRLSSPRLHYRSLKMI